MLVLKEPNGLRGALVPMPRLPNGNGKPDNNFMQNRKHSDHWPIHSSPVRSTTTATPPPVSEATYVCAIAPLAIRTLSHTQLLPLANLSVGTVGACTNLVAHVQTGTYAANTSSELASLTVHTSVRLQTCTRVLAYIFCANTTKYVHTYMEAHVDWLC